MTTEQLEKIHEALKFHTDESEAFSYGISEENGELVTKFICSSPDIYMMIDQLNEDKLHTNFDTVSFITYGWAAPLNADGEVEGQPSKHPERKRVRLVISASNVDKKVIGSSLEFSGGDEVIYDLGEASGSLQEAILDLVS